MRKSSAEDICTSLSSLTEILGRLEGGDPVGLSEMIAAMEWAIERIGFLGRSNQELTERIDRAVEELQQ